MTKVEKFVALTVPLQDSNLIEASAGTGKTYSIAILVLRLLLEKKIAINQILMVTFTKAAVAELEERIRMFIRSAYKVSLGETIKDSTITKLVSDIIHVQGSEEVQNNLKAAILFLDETSVLTIHSFCQQTLTGFAFETNQLFGAEILQDTSSILAEEVNKFWRENITTLPTSLLANLIDASLSRESISAIVREHLNGKKYLAYDPAKKYNQLSGHYETILQSISDLEQKEALLKNALIEHINTNKSEIIAAGKGNAYFTKSITPFIDSPEELISAIWEKKNTAYVLKAFETTLLPQIEVVEDLALQRKQLVNQIITQVHCFAISNISIGIQEYKQRNNLLSFDDMIVNLHKAFLHEESTNLVKALRAKYKAVFIDEFQDTDRLQYEIFQKAFAEETILFYIGDPKQSIYAWRKADIFTYFKAAEHVAHRYNMNQNFRSSEKLIAAMNKFFLPESTFDTFYFNDAENQIKYIPVESPEPNEKGHLILDHNPDVPISITQLANKHELNNAVSNQVAALFTEGKYLIEKNGERRGITPADIGILVRTNSEGHAMKAAMASKGIPAVTINDARVLQSPEAIFMLYLLQAIKNLTLPNISKALLSPFTGYAVADILQLDEDKTIELFRNYNALWAADGIYAALMQFVADYDVRNVLLSGNSENGERTITNLFQLIELVHKIQNDKRFSPTELIGWLQRSTEGMEIEGDQYEQRIENDEESVKIVTIHKSKGLEYNIVIAPFLDFVNDKSQQPFCSFRHPESGDYVSVERAQLTDEQKHWLEEQTEQENRRLLYVSVTRAVYKCFIFKNQASYYKNSTLTTFVNVINNDKANEADNNKRLINFLEPLQNVERYNRRNQWRPPLVKHPITFNLAQKNWTRISYTMLAAKGEISLKPRNNNSLEKYDQFIFKQLTRGAKTGNLLHYLFENIDFSSQHFWPYQITQAIKRFAPRLENEYSPMLLQLLMHITQATITMGSDTFSLSAISMEKRLNELEFDFNVPLFDPSVLQVLRDEKTDVSIKYFEQAEGIMNGKVDMFFEHDNKYYILDWKSNYLGDHLSYYRPALLNSAMNESNYHLQYLIYTVAVKKYLESRLPSFNYEQHFGGVVYLFVRGVRSNSDTGIFVTRPPLQQIEALEALVSD